MNYPLCGLTELDVFKVLKQEKIKHPDWSHAQLIARAIERTTEVGFENVPAWWVSRILIERAKEF